MNSSSIMLLKFHSRLISLTVIALKVLLSQYHYLSFLNITTHSHLQDLIFSHFLVSYSLFFLNFFFVKMKGKLRQNMTLISFDI